MKAATIIVNNLNDGQYLPGLLDSIRDQDRRDFDLVGIDAGSTDDSLDVYARYGVSVIDCTGLNQARSVNKVVAGLRTVAFSWINPDDRYLPNFLGTHLDAIERGADIVLSDLLIQNVAGGQRHHAARGIEASLADGQNYVFHPTTMVRRAAWQRLGRFDGSYRFAFDFEFWIRAARAHAVFEHVRKATAVFCPRPGSLTGTRTDAIRAEIRRVQEQYDLPTNRRYRP